MSDTDLVRMIGRLEKAIDDGTKENSRRFDAVFQELADQKKAIGRLGDKSTELERRMAHAEGSAANAQRKAFESAHEIEVVNVSLVRHMSGLEESIRVGKAETDARLDRQDAELVSIQGVLSSQSENAFKIAKQGNARLAIYAGIIIAMVPLAQRLLDWLLK